METLTPILTFGPISQELADVRFTQQNGALIVDLFPRDIYYEPMSASPSDAEKALEDIGAQKVVAGRDFLRLNFDYIDALSYCGPDETPDLFPWIADRDSGPCLDDQTWPYPLLKVENSPWAKDMIGHIGHYRVVGPFFTLDILGYEPDGEWLENPAHSSP